jgi:hypothetical protein
MVSNWKPHSYNTCFIRANASVIDTVNSRSNQEAPPSMQCPSRSAQSADRVANWAGGGCDGLRRVTGSTHNNISLFALLGNSLQAN